MNSTVQAESFTSRNLWARGNNPTMDLREFAEKRLAALRIGPFEAAKRAGLERTFVRDIVIGRKQTVLGRNLAKLAVALETTSEEIAGAIRGEAVDPTVVTAVPRRQARSEVTPASVEVPQASSMPRDLPIYGTAAGAIVAGKLQGFALDPTKVVDRVRRPPGVAGAADAYALYVVDNSMAPMHSAGELRIVHPGRPVRPGDSAIIQVRAGEGLPVEAFIKIFMGRTVESVVARQINPEATHRFKSSTVVAVHRVLTTAELVEG